MKKAIIFDFDGTLVDTSELERVALLDTINKYGDKNFSIDDLENYFGPNEYGILKNILIEECLNDAWRYFLGNYGDFQEKLANKNTEIEELLNELSLNKGLDLFLVTGRSVETCDISLSYFGFKKYFKRVYTGSPKGVNKDKNILSILEEYNLNKDDVIYVGDTVQDVYTMKKIELDILSVNYFHDKKYGEELEKANPGNVIYSIKELKEKLLKITPQQ